MKIRFILLLCAAIATARAASGGYLFVTFKGEQNPMTEQIYFALSKDGRNWQALNHGEPVLVSQLGEKGVRDPYLLRAHDGKKFYLLATDLSVALNRDWGRAVRAGSRSLVIWESTDLVQWSAPRLVPVAPDDAGCTWAPEAVYDEDAGDYLVFWASTTKRDDFAKHRIWAARTKDFRAFSPPFVFIEKPTTIIDTTIVRDGGKYYRFTKDEQFKAIAMEESAKLAGPWHDVTGFSLAKLVGYEGPECYPLQPVSGEPPMWCLILDYYSKGQGYQPFTTHDLAGGHFEPASGFVFPFHFRHGSVLPLSADEFQKLENAAAIASTAAGTPPSQSGKP
ncbi:MAG TPA: glycoside hydrolase family 43 protein [Lacunisphaera sp.]